MRVAILGGTGKFGRALAARLHDHGTDVAIGSRDPERAQQAATELGVSGGANGEVVKDVDLVILAVQSRAALDTARELADAIGSTPLLSVASDLRFTDDGVLPGTEGESLAEQIAAVVSAPVASGLHTLSAVHLAKREPLDEDVLVCGEDPTKQLALDLAQPLLTGRAIDAGPLANSRGLEGMTAVILNVNRRYRANAGIRLTGLS